MSARPLQLWVGGFRRVRVADRTEIEVACTVLAGGEYGIGPIPDDGVIVDLGANVGDVEGSEFAIVASFTDWARVRFIVCEVHGQRAPIEDALAPTHDVRWVEVGYETLLAATRHAGSVPTWSPTSARGVATTC